MSKDGPLYYKLSDYSIVKMGIILCLLNLKIITIFLQLIYNLNRVCLVVDTGSLLWMVI